MKTPHLVLAPSGPYFTSRTVMAENIQEAIELAKDIDERKFDDARPWGENIENYVIVISGFADEASIQVDEMERNPDDDRWYEPIG